MDKFTRYVLLTMVIVLTSIVVSTYIGVYLYGGDMETKYLKVMEEEAERLGLKYGHLVELGEEGEYVAFSIAGAISGLIIGYLMPSIFEAKAR